MEHISTLLEKMNSIHSMVSARPKARLNRDSLFSSVQSLSRVPFFGTP